MNKVLYRLASLQNDKVTAIGAVNRYVASINEPALFDCDCFVGVIDINNVDETQIQLGEQDCCIYMSFAYPGKCTLLRRHYRIHSDYVAHLTCTSSYHRGKNPIFSNHVKMQATAGIECWLIVAKRLFIVRDIRTLIARLLWKDRHLWF